jgi:exfoliative toxin A/B
MMKFVKSVPMAICGLALSLAALGNLLLPYGENIRYVCGVLSAIVLLIFALKVCLDFPHAREELKTPIPLSVLPTSTMALMLLSAYIKPFVGDLATGVWYLAVILHLGFMVLFFLRFLRGFKLNTVFPSWFIVFVGIVTASVTAPAMAARPLGQALFYIGFVFYFIALALVAVRMARVKLFPEPARPTIAIFTAPMSLCVVGYFNSFEQRNPFLIYIMLAIAAASYLYVTIMMFSLLRIKFYPTYAAFTFPYVISAIAFRLGNGFLVGQGVTFFTPVTLISVWLAVAAVLYVLIHYVRYFLFWLKF